MVGIIEAAKGDIVVALLVIFVVMLVGLMVWIYKKVITFVLDSLQNKMSKLCKDSDTNRELNKQGIKISSKNLKIADKILESLSEITKTQEEIRKELNGRSSLGNRMETIEKTLRELRSTINEKK
jgi:flagellar biosynthesis protein FlhB